MTDACEKNITFPQLRWPVVKKVLHQGETRTAPSKQDTPVVQFHNYALQTMQHKAYINTAIVVSHYGIAQ